MKIAVVVGIALFMLADAFLMWCLLRASALREQEAQKCRKFSEGAAEEGQKEGL